ncbi:MAG: hypothetical protein Q9227_000788 [Pyrenula ochraceoflavens]
MLRNKEDSTVFPANQKSVGRHFGGSFLLKDHEFSFLDAPTIREPPASSKGLEHVFGESPHRTWCSGSEADLLDQLQVGKSGRLDINKALEVVQVQLRNYGPFDGIIAFSEGSTVAATLLASEDQQDRAPVRFAVFISGNPALTLNYNGDATMRAEPHKAIRLPTCHVLGSRDPNIERNMELYQQCDSANAVLIDHGKGHIIPSDSESVARIVGGICQVGQV